MTGFALNQTTGTGPSSSYTPILTMQNVHQRPEPIAGPSSKPLNSIDEFLSDQQPVAGSSRELQQQSQQQKQQQQFADICKACDFSQDLQDFIDCCCASPSAFMDACPDAQGDTCAVLPFPDCSGCADAQAEHQGQQHLHISAHGQTLCAFPPVVLPPTVPNLLGCSDCVHAQEDHVRAQVNLASTSVQNGVSNAPTGSHWAGNQSCDANAATITASGQKCAFTGCPFMDFTTLYSSCQAPQVAPTCTFTAATNLNSPTTKTVPSILPSSSSSSSNGLATLPGPNSTASVMAAFSDHILDEDLWQHILKEHFETNAPPGAGHVAAYTHTHAHHHPLPLSMSNYAQAPENDGQIFSSAGQQQQQQQQQQLSTSSYALPEQSTGDSSFNSHLQFNNHQHFHAHHFPGCGFLPPPPCGSANACSSLALSSAEANTQSNGNFISLGQGTNTMPQPTIPCGSGTDTASMERLFSQFLPQLQCTTCLPAAAPGASERSSVMTCSGDGSSHCGTNMNAQFLSFCNGANFTELCKDPTHVPSITVENCDGAVKTNSRKRPASQMLQMAFNPTQPCPIDMLQALKCTECIPGNPTLGGGTLDANAFLQACSAPDCMPGLGMNGQFPCCPMESYNPLCNIGYGGGNFASGSAMAGLDSCCEGLALGQPHDRPCKRACLAETSSAAATGLNSPSLASVISSLPSGIGSSSPSSRDDVHTISDSTLPSPMHLGVPTRGSLLDSEEEEGETDSMIGEGGPIDLQSDAAATAAATLLARGLRSKKQSRAARSAPKSVVQPSARVGTAPSTENATSEEGIMEADEHVCQWKGCQIQFASSAELTAHLTEAHVGSGKSEYVCLWEGCDRNGRVFTQRQKLCRHLQSHTGDRPHQCHICQKRFTETMTLSQHIRAAHTTERPYKCDFPGCNKAFSVAGSLTIHKRTHSGEKPFKCPFEGCDKAFAESSNLSKHVRVHTGARPFICPECGHGFARPDGLERHKKVHLRQREKESKELEGGGHAGEVEAQA
ncbi:hypothetical protein CF326_g1795 [Tilletia indica]|nr:hypothetical protein CF326_g1795 [Tilletia indica]